ncbi:MAG: L-aspartate oxidase [Marinifilaceae bacterium]
MCKFDYIVVGSGLAGLYAAFKAAAHGTVAILTKSQIEESNSYFAQGGIAAVTDEDDDPSLHFEDTIIAGRGLCDHPAVEILVNEGPERISELIAEGMHFDMEDGSLALGLEGGHHRKRILHAGGDATGRMVTTFMIGKVLNHPNITILQQHSVLGLLTDNGVCYGVRAWDHSQDKELLFYADNTFLTLGGTSAIYKRTTNPHTTIGDGLAIAYEAGCEVVDLEFIQFHPSAMCIESEEAFLISEAVRGEGAHLINQRGERFMTTIHELAELAPRDIVAQSIYKEMMKHNDDFVWLSLKHLDPAMIKHRFPTIYQKCKDYDIDMCNRIPVAPAAHYTVGGVRTDTEGRTSIKHLFVCGELASSGIMGANRLASNSLIECLVFGKRAVDATLTDPKIDKQVSFIPRYYVNPQHQAGYEQLKKDVSRIMTRHAGIIRTEECLKAGLEKIDALQQSLPEPRNEYYRQVSRNLLKVAQLIIRSALYREESRGGHFRSDFPTTNENYRCHVVQKQDEGIHRTPVII